MDEKNNTQLRLLDYMNIFVQRRWFIILSTFFGTLIFMGIAFLLPKQYMTVASVKSSNNSGFNIGSLVKSSGLGGGLGALTDLAGPSGGGNADYLFSILTSRSVLDSVIYRLDLKEKYGIKEIEDVREILLGNMFTDINYPADLIYFGVYDEDPEKAARLTNLFVYYLKKIYTKLNIDAGENNRLNLEQRYGEIVYDLETAEDTLTKFQEKFGILEPTIQTEVSLRTAASIKAELMLKEIEANTRIKILGENSPGAVLLKEQMKEMKNKYSEFLTGLDKNQPSDFFIPFDKTPKLAMEYFKLFRRVEINSELMKIIIPLIEQAKIQELRETSSLIVLDTGVVPEKKSKPRRLIIALIGFALSLLFSVSYVFVKGNLRNLEKNNPSAYQKIHSISQTVISDFKFWKKS